MIDRGGEGKGQHGSKVTSILVSQIGGCLYGKGQTARQGNYESAHCHSLPGLMQLGRVCVVITCSS